MISDLIHSSLQIYLYCYSIDEYAIMVTSIIQQGCVMGDLSKLSCQYWGRFYISKFSIHNVYVHTIEYMCIYDIYTN